jgi:Lactonase, 7-bladed beta-propeller
MRLRSIILLFFAFIFALTIVTGCGGAAGKSVPPAGASISSTFVYFANGNPFSTTGATTLVFKLNGDGTLTAGSSFTDPDIIFGQSGSLLLGTKGDGTIGTSLYSVNTQTGVPQARVSAIQDSGGVTDGSTVYISGRTNQGGIDAYSISAAGQFARIPGSPFGAPASGSPANDYLKLQLRGPWLFGAFGTTGILGNITVFSRSSTGALARQFDFGNGDLPFNFVVHPGARFAYVVSDAPSLDVYSLDLNAGLAPRIQQMSDPSGGGYITLDPSGKYLFLFDNGFREFSVDQASGKLTEIAAPSFPPDRSGGSLNFDPTGRFILLVRSNSVTVYALNSSDGSLTQVGPVYAIGDNLTLVAFASF